MFKKNLLTPVIPLLAAVFFTSSPASAAAIRTASFEAPVLNSGGIQYGPDEFAFNTNAIGPVIIPNFTFTGFSGIIKNGAQGVFNDTSFGTQAAFLQSYQDTGSGISWAINGLNVGQTYTLSFYDAASLVVPGESFSVSAFGSAPIFFSPSTTYTMQSFDFLATASSGSIDFIGPSVPGNSASAIDNIQISTIPEPITLSLFGVGLAGAAAMRRRKSAIPA